MNASLENLLNGTVQTPQPKYPALVLMVIPALTIFGNILVVLSVLRERTLQTVTNYFIVSLAVADFLVALCVMPFAVYVEVVHMSWNLGRDMCNVYVFCDVCASTASILNLVAISVDRYMAITRPIYYSRHGRNLNRAVVTCGIVWTTSILIAVPVLLGGNKQELEAKSCEFTNPIYIIVSSLGSFYIPCIIMVILYSIILKRLYDREKRKKNSKAKRYKPSTLFSGQALLGGARLAREMGKRLREKAEEDMLQQTVVIPPSESKPKTAATITSTTSSDEDETSTSSRPSPVVPVPEITELASTSQMTSDCTPNLNTPLAMQVVRLDTDLSPVADSSITDLKVDLKEQRSNSITNRSFGEDFMDNFHFIDSKGSSRAGSQKSRAPTLDLNNMEDFSQTPYGSLKQRPDQLNNVKESPLNKKRLSPERMARIGHLLTSGVNQSRSINLRSSLRRARKALWRGLTGIRLKTLKPKSKHMAKKEQKQIRKERKATHTLAVVLAVFLLCWVPFFTCHLTNSICMVAKPAVKGQPYGQGCITFIAFFLTTWLGYMNSFMNPIIYTIFNSEYRRAFRRLLLCQR